MTKPIETELVSRRALNRIALVTAGSAAALAGAAEKKGCKVVTDLAALDDLAEVGKIVEVKYPTPSDAAFLMRLDKKATGGVGDGEAIVGFLRACPHMGCAVQTAQTEGNFVAKCPCHRSCFDLHSAGQQLFGRASQNLVQIRLDLRARRVFGVGLFGSPFGQPLSDKTR